MTTQPAVDEAKLNEFAGDLGAVLHAATVLIGDKLGLYKAMADSELITAGGFNRFRRATETPFNLVLEARP